MLSVTLFVVAVSLGLPDGVPPHTTAEPGAGKAGLQPQQEGLKAPADPFPAPTNGTLIVSGREYFLYIEDQKHPQGNLRSIPSAKVLDANGFRYECSFESSL